MSTQNRVTVSEIVASVWNVPVPESQHKPPIQVFSVHESVLPCCIEIVINFPVNCRNFLKFLKLAEFLYHLAKLRLVFKHLRPIDTNIKMSKTY